MSKKNTYNQGVASGLKVAQKIMEREVEAMDYLKLKIDLIADGHDEMKNAVNHLIEDTDENAIAQIYGICNPVKPNELKDHEQKMLINILATLGAVNDYQKRYYNNLRHHLNIEGYEPDTAYDFRNIESIESVKSVRTLAKAVRIHLFLENLNMDGNYIHEDDLFSHFEMRSFDEIDNVIETIFCLFGVDGLVEFYGDFEGEVDERNLSYLDVEEKEYVEISNECAQIYFKDCYVYDSNKSYIESSSYVIFNNGNDIECIHKKTGIKKKLIENVEEAGKFLKEGKAATFQDMIYFVEHNDLFFINIETLESGKVCHIEEIEKDNGELYEITQILIYKGEKIIYKNGYQFFIMDFAKGVDSIHKLMISSESGMCHMNGDYLYYVSMEPDLDDMRGKGIKSAYKLKRFGIINEQETVVSKAFGKHDVTKEIYQIESEGILEDVFFCIVSYQFVGSIEKTNNHGFYFNLNGSNVETHDFYLWNANIYQIEHYKNYVVYTNGDKGYSLIAHDFITDKKNVLLRNFGKNEKSSFMERFLLGKSEFMKPFNYMRLGKWIWVRENDKITPRILQLC